LLPLIICLLYRPIHRAEDREETIFAHKQREVSVLRANMVIEFGIEEV